MLNNPKLDYDELKRSYSQKWLYLFDLAGVAGKDNLDKPLSPKILSDPSSPVTILLLYIYSMESFIYTDLNRACREKDKSKIPYYGAFAAALSYIIYFANTNKKNSGPSAADLQSSGGCTKLYRGIKMTKESIT